MSQRIFNNSTEKNICEEYINGKSLSQLAKDYKCSVCAINGALKRNHTKTRSSIEALKLIDRKNRNISQRVFSNATEEKICDKYINGKSLSQLAKEYKCSICAIKGALRRNNTKTRTSIEGSKLIDKQETFNQDQKSNIISRYLSGESCNKISKSFNVSFHTVERVIKAAGIKTRTKREGDNLQRKFNDIRENDICFLYRGGWTTGEIGIHFGCHRTFINRVLTRNKFILRKSVESKILKKINRLKKLKAMGQKFNIKKKPLKEFFPPKLKSNLLSTKEENAICLSYQGGWSITEISKHLKYNNKLITHVLTNNKILLRSSTESNNLKKIKRIKKLKAMGKKFNVKKKPLKEFFPSSLKPNSPTETIKNYNKVFKKNIYLEQEIGLLRIIDILNWNELPDEQKLFIYKEKPLNNQLNSLTYNRFSETYCTKCGRHQFLPVSRLITHQENINNPNKECITCMWCELKNSQDLTGKIYGKWKAIRWRRITSIEDPFKFPKIEWLCLCLNCKKTTRWIQKHYFRNMNSHGKDRGCGCNTRQHRGLYKKIGRDVMTHYYSIRAKSKQKNIPFDLEPEDFIPPDKCPILGIPLIRNNKQDNSPNSPSLDRFYPDDGYIKTNVQFISFRANRLKNNGTPEQWIKLADWCQREDIKHKLSWNNVENK